jgi:hypothetical protein
MIFLKEHCVVSESKLKVKKEELYKDILSSVQKMLLMRFDYITLI